LESLIILAAMFALLWVLLIRPQRKRQLDQQKLLSSIDVGDEVLTVGGLYGIVREIDEEDDLVVEVSENINVRIARRAVATVVKPDDEADEADEADEDDEHGAEPDTAEVDAEPVVEEPAALAANSVQEDAVTTDEDSVSTVPAGNPVDGNRG
jgi:preprotein translocase subunit YajC